MATRAKAKGINFASNVIGVGTGSGVQSVILRPPKPFEHSVRPFVQISDTLPEPPAARVPLPGEGSEAFAAWGGPSSLSFIPPVAPVEDVNADNFVELRPGPQYKTEWGDKKAPREKQQQDKKEKVTTLQEMDRKVETITVYKPGDNTVWVNVQRILVIRFRQSGGPTIALPKEGATRNKGGKKKSVFFPERNEQEKEPPRSEPIGHGQIIVMKMKPPPPPKRPEDKT